MNKENNKTEKEAKPILKEILEFAKLNQQQLCDLLPESTIVVRQINVTNKGTALQRAEAANYHATIGKMKGRVEWLELQAREVTAKRIVFTSEQVERGIKNSSITEILDVLIIKEEDSGTAQVINTHIRKRTPDIYSKLGLGQLEATPVDSVKIIEDKKVKQHPTEKKTEKENAI